MTKMMSKGRNNKKTLPGIHVSNPFQRVALI
jgi:hypothetical protein